jgi:hypothetical protein
MSLVDAYAAARAAVTEMFALVESDDQTCCLAHVLQFTRDGKPGRMKVLLVSKLTSFNLQQTPTGFTFETHLEQDYFPEAFPRFMDLIVSRTSGAFDYVVRQVKLERALISVDVADLIAIYGPFRLHLSEPDRMLYVGNEALIRPRGEEMVRELLRRLLSPVQRPAAGLTMEDVGPGEASDTPPSSSPIHAKAQRRKKR